MNMKPRDEFKQDEDDYKFDMRPAPQFRKINDDYELNMKPTKQNSDDSYQLNMEPIYNNYKAKKELEEMKEELLREEEEYKRHNGISR